jgi:hypothetical protein
LIDSYACYVVVLLSDVGDKWFAMVMCKVMLLHRVEWFEVVGCFARFVVLVGDGCLFGVGVRSLIKISVVCFCVVIGVWGVGSFPVPVLVRYGTLVVGRNGTCGALCCGNVAGGAVPVPYRYCMVRYGIGVAIGMLWIGIGNASGISAGVVPAQYGLAVGGSGWGTIVRCGKVHLWSSCGLAAILVLFFE